MTLRCLLHLLPALFAISCSQKMPEQTMQDINGNLITVGEPQWEVNEDVYTAMPKGSSRIEISVDQKSLKLLDASGRVAIRTDCSTGMAGKETPRGRFTILEMLKDKRSNKYGRYISSETGDIVVERSWEVNGPPAGTKFQGTEMPYWMRLTWDGVGIHVGKFARGYNSSFGCIRVPEHVQPLVYAKCRVGTLVRVF